MCVCGGMCERCIRTIKTNMDPRIRHLNGFRGWGQLGQTFWCLLQLSSVVAACWPWCWKNGVWIPIAWKQGVTSRHQLDRRKLLNLHLISEMQGYKKYGWIAGLNPTTVPSILISGAKQGPTADAPKQSSGSLSWMIMLQYACGSSKPSPGLWIYFYKEKTNNSP